MNNSTVFKIIIDRWWNGHISIRSLQFYVAYFNLFTIKCIIRFNRQMQKETVWLINFRLHLKYLRNNLHIRQIIMKFCYRYHHRTNWKQLFCLLGIYYVSWMWNLWICNFKVTSIIWANFDKTQSVKICHGCIKAS